MTAVHDYREMLGHLASGGSGLQQGYLITTADDKRLPIVGTMIIGRGEGADIYLDDNAVSRKHVELQARENGYYWRDLGSTNGTLLNERSMREGRLRPG